MVNTMFVMKSLKTVKPQCRIDVGHQKYLGKVHMANLHGVQYKIVAVQIAIHIYDKWSILILLPALLKWVATVAP